ncbi:MAG: helix-turn-helix domain-containing protein [Candidatus Limimorpha sp.]
MRNKLDLTHPMVHDARRISDEGIVIFHNVGGLPTEMEPFVSSYYVISIVHRGCQNVMYENIPDINSRRTVAVIFPKHSLTAESQTDDFRASLIVVMKDVLNEPLLQIINQYRYHYESRPAVRLGEHEYKILMSIVNVMYETSRIDITDKHVLMIRQLEYFLRLLGYYRQQIFDELKSTKRVSTQFYSAIASHFRQHRDVGFYADLAHLTPKYFGTLILRETGHTASYWIHKQVISEAQMLLLNCPDLSIQAIADMLGFEEQQVFSRYFRRETGISPTEFRKRK